MSHDGLEDLSNAKLEAQLCFALYSATNAVIRSYNTRLKVLGLAYEHYLVLLSFWQDGPATLNELSKRLTVSTAKVDQYVQHLERAELLVWDRNATRMVLTEKGMELEGAVYDVQQSIDCAIGLDAGTLDFMRGELNILSRRLTQEEEKPQDLD